MARDRKPLHHHLETAPMSDDLRELARRGELIRYPKGAVLIQEGSQGDTLYIVLDGRLRVYGSHATNEREITHGTYGPGEYVGEMSLDGGARSASVMATEPTVCSMVTRRTLEVFLAERPVFAFELLAKVIRRARAATLHHHRRGRPRSPCGSTARQGKRSRRLDVPLDARHPGRPAKRVGGQHRRRRALDVRPRRVAGGAPPAPEVIFCHSVTPARGS
jgi:CRP-like cAMP-binding protein